MAISTALVICAVIMGMGASHEMFHEVNPLQTSLSSLIVRGLSRIRHYSSSLCYLSNVAFSTTHELHLNDVHREDCNVTGGNYDICIRQNEAHPTTYHNWSHVCPTATSTFT